MKHIVLICAAGMSTSMLVQRMKKSAKEKAVEAEILAMPESKFEEYDAETDVLLLGPQISYMLDELKEKYEAQGIKVAAINMMDYGMMNGEKVLTEALELLDS